jgi:hypothetical protein
MSDNFEKNLQIFSSEPNKGKKFKFTRKKRGIRTSQKIIIAIFLVFIFFLIFLYFHSQKVIKEILSEEQLFQQDKIIELDTARDRVSKENYELSSARFIRTFGDSFTGLSAINRDLSDMYWDPVVSAFLFPPRLSMKKLEDCDDKACGYYIHDEKWQGFCNQDLCLENNNNQLFLDGEPLSLPEEIDQERLISISLGGVASDWYLAFIFGENNHDEEAFIYRFDGEKFYPLINNDTEFQFKINQASINGHISFGGQVNDLYLVYGGYYGKIYRLIEEKKLIDLSNFFSLRFTTAGFFPKIQSSEKSQAIYICNTKYNQVNILKLWQDKKGEVIGAVDLQNLALSGLSARKIDCLPGDNYFDLKILVQARDNSWQLWGMIDNGFNNQIIRQVISRDINSTNKVVKAAIISSYSINSEKSWEDTFQLFFSADGENYTPVLPGKWYEIKEKEKNLYWRIIFRNDMNNPYYSPWLNNMSVINYEIAEDNQPD